MAIKYTIYVAYKRQNVSKQYQHLTLQDLPKFTQIWIFGLKIYVPSGNQSDVRYNNFSRIFGAKVRQTFYELPEIISEKIDSRKHLFAGKLSKSNADYYRVSHYI
jgi:hypothetical protein